MVQSQSSQARHQRGPVPLCWKREYTQQANESTGNFIFWGGSRAACDHTAGRNHDRLGASEFRFAEGRGPSLPPTCHAVAEGVGGRRRRKAAPCVLCTTIRQNRALFDRIYRIYRIWTIGLTPRSRCAKRNHPVDPGDPVHILFGCGWAGLCSFVAILRKAVSPMNVPGPPGGSPDSCWRRAAQNAHRLEVLTMHHACAIKRRHNRGEP